jgi:hypothetical protein
MSQNALEYFENTIMPMIEENYAEMVFDMDIMILGSVGLGIDDDISDIEVAIYLDDKLWKSRGKQLQLLLNDCLTKTNRWKKEGSIICVHPVSWLLDGNAEKFLIDTDELPWEKVSFETLFVMQENTILYNSRGILSRLREITSVSKYPEHLWKKFLIIKLKELILEDFFELNKSVQRNHLAEANIIFGNVIQGIYHIAFLISHQYYPWRTHLHWAFENLPVSKSERGFKINLLLATNDWNERVNIINSIIDYYRNYIKTNNLIPEIEILSTDLEQELIWAERLSAWNTPNWRNYIEQRKKAALDNGYSSDQFWVWSLWR